MLTKSVLCGMMLTAMIALSGCVTSSQYKARLDFGADYHVNATHQTPDPTVSFRMTVESK